MSKIVCATIIFWSAASFAVFSNYSSVLIGRRTAGMGGGGISLTDDASSAAYYNPATLARLVGSSLSAQASLFNKYDENYGSPKSLNSSVVNINKGTILAIPASSGIYTSFHNFTTGLSIVIPEYENFGGVINSSGNDSTFLHLEEQSLWIGAAIGLNLTDRDAIGMSTYYTSETYTRSLTNRYDISGGTNSDVEDTSFTANSLIYQLGYFRQLSAAWHLGVTFRPRSIPIAGTGSYLSSSVSTVSGAATPIEYSTLNARADTPDRIGVGLSYRSAHRQTYAADLNWYGSNSFDDIASNGDRIEQKPILNAAIGYENTLAPWLSLRLGAFTDLASSPTIPSAPTRRYQDHIDKYGFTANIGVKTTRHTTVDLGGYYLGGVGTSSELIDGSYTRLKKSDYLFSFLVGSAYVF